MEKSKKILYEQIEKLLHMKAGDISRLEHIKESIEQNRRIYKSDYSYIQDLAKVQGLKTFESPDETFGFLKFCKKCNGELLTGAKFCSFCGTEQNRYSDFDEVLSRRKLLDQSRKILAKIRAYHILAVAGGFAVLIPVFVAISSIDRIEELIIFYFDYDISEFENFFYGLGTISILWSLFVIVLPFVLKRPKQVGKFLFFSSFVLLLVSLLSGIMGFVLILIGGIIALKRRYPI
ncbi:MAG: zinc ribbon domain-containing protein [Candidatus Nitrosomaritimum yanchengensis]